MPFCVILFLRIILFGCQKVHDGGQKALAVLNDEALNGVGSQGGGEVNRVIQNLDGGSRSRGLEDGSDLDVVGGGTVKVVGAAKGVEEVEGGLGLSVARRQDLEEIGLTAASLPAGAVTVLLSAGNLAVEEPDGGHIASSATGVTTQGHGELEEEDLVRTTESLCSI